MDVREDLEFAADHAEGAVHIGRGVLERNVERLVPDRGADIRSLCGGGFRSVLAAESLQRMGYTRVCSMAGGIHTWRAAGYPVEAGESYRAGTRRRRRPGSGGPRAGRKSQNNGP